MFPTEYYVHLFWLSLSGAAKGMYSSLSDEFACRRKQADFGATSGTSRHVAEPTLSPLF
jgi:hypothetical protein